MAIKVEVARTQASFMLSALREMRADDRSLKKKQQESKEGIGGELLGPLLGPAIKADKGSASPPPGFVAPENLEFMELEIDLPVGFRRLRWALLNHSSVFTKDALWIHESKYEKYVSFFVIYEVNSTLCPYLPASLFFSLQYQHWGVEPSP